MAARSKGKKIMTRQMLRSKIHRAVVTGADLNYEGSISIDQTLLEASGILPYEKVLILNLANGARAETYAIPGKRNSGEIVMNGAIARLVQVGDPVIIMTFGEIEESLAADWMPTVVLVDGNNKILEKNKY
jgi:aspartate 1-decarboxylase